MALLQNILFSVRLAVWLYRTFARPRERKVRISMVRISMMRIDVDWGSYVLN